MKYKDIEISFHRKLINNRNEYNSLSEIFLMRTVGRYELRKALLKDSTEIKEFIENEIKPTRDFLSEFYITETLRIMELSTPEYLEAIDEMSEKQLKKLNEYHLHVEAGVDKDEIKEIFSNMKNLDKNTFENDLDLMVVNILTKKKYLEFLENELDTIEIINSVSNQVIKALSMNNDFAFRAPDEPIEINRLEVVNLIEQAQHIKAPTKEELEKQIKASVEKAVKKQFNTNGEQDSLLTIDEAAIFLDLAKQTIYGMTSARTIPFIKQGKRLRFRKSELVQWLIKEKRKSISEMEEELDNE